ncbi:hypothetical protein BD289DRAFT_244559 [Coniella lustricola]|uniref:Uncharacterized protein n=1 Tax=Coniella lustricola TaxID=2025994 RepID=A0A2T3A932_9PEZI|nr:hypothetical protein BD289DRAFT_244559 [Coniella lustricola]
MALVFMTTRPILTSGKVVHHPAVSTATDVALSSAGYITKSQAEEIPSAVDKPAYIPADDAPQTSNMTSPIIPEQPRSGAADEDIVDHKDVTVEFDQVSIGLSKLSLVLRDASILFHGPSRAVIMISEAFNCQTGHRYLSEASKHFTVFQPTASSKAVPFPKSTKGQKPHGAIQPNTGSGDKANPSAGKITGATIGGIAGLLLLYGGAYLIVTRSIRWPETLRNTPSLDSLACEAFDPDIDSAGLAKCKIRAAGFLQILLRAQDDLIKMGLHRQWAADMLNEPQTAYWIRQAFCCSADGAGFVRSAIFG